jgi:hypothetical protein
LVPKPLKHADISDGPRMWRLDFHKMEAKDLKGYKKTVIRLLKVRNLNISTVKAV